MTEVISKNIWTLNNSANAACPLSSLLRHDDCFVCCFRLFLFFTELSLNLCWHVVVLMSRIMCKVVKGRAHRWSDGLLRGEGSCIFRFRSALHSRGQLLFWVKNENNLLFFCHDFSKLSALKPFFKDVFKFTMTASFFLLWVFLVLKLIAVFMKSF